jgi:hypothetical protein
MLHLDLETADPCIPLLFVLLSMWDTTNRDSAPGRTRQEEQVTGSRVNPVACRIFPDKAAGNAFPSLRKNVRHSEQSEEPLYLSLLLLVLLSSIPTFNSH